MKMKFSFDDEKIGRLKESGRSLDSKVNQIDRPKGLTQDEWYGHAGKVAAFLNNLDDEEPKP